MLKLKNTAMLIVVMFLFIPLRAGASPDEVLCTGEDLSEDYIQKVIGELEISSAIDQVLLTKEEQNSYSSSDSRTDICTYMKKLEPGSGIKVDINNFSYVTQEMVTEAMIISGMKDVEVKFFSPYSVSGYLSVVPAVKAYEKLSDDKLAENAVTAAGDLLAIMGELGRRFGNKKALQFINESIKDAASFEKADDDRIISLLLEKENMFSMKLEDDEKDRTSSAIKKLCESELTLETLDSQQKNISTYISDLSDTSYKYPFFKRLYSDIMMFLKKAAMLFNA